MTEEARHATQRPSRLTLYALAMLGGVGMTAMILAAGVGVIFGASLSADETHSLGMMIVVGMLVLLLAVGLWMAWVRPFQRFDDINVPAEAEPH